MMIHTSPPHIFNIEVIYYVDTDNTIAASYITPDVPAGKLPPGGKDVELTEQELANYEAFVENVEDLLVDYYEFDVYYTNKSKDNSYYYDMLAKGDDGEILFRFTFNLRISTHGAHRSKQSQHSKKLAKQKLLEKTGGKRLIPIHRDIVVNNEIFDTYDDVIDYLMEVIDTVVSRMSGH